MKISIKISTLLRWVFAIPVAWIILSTLRNFLDDNLYLSFLPLSSNTLALTIAALSMFLGTVAGALVLLKLLPKYQPQALFVLTISYIVYQIFTNSSFGYEDFILDSAFFLGSLFAYSVSRKGFRMRLKV